MSAAEAGPATGTATNGAARAMAIDGASARMVISARDCSMLVMDVPVGGESGRQLTTTLPPPQRCSAAATAHENPRASSIALTAAVIAAPQRWRRAPSPRFFNGEKVGMRGSLHTRARCNNPWLLSTAGLAEAAPHPNPLPA